MDDKLRPEVASRNSQSLLLRAIERIDHSNER